ncbi:MAG TPA: SDR family NAD(P)-dependent oxidoreductase, partial [Capillimicrobium sp.]
MGRRLDGQRILITGASSGVGAAAVRAFAEEGARLAILARSAEALEEAARDAGVDALVLPVDVTDRRAVERAVALTARELGGIDV